ncbi:SAM-dependent methyltransferase [Nonomuraea mangrovi]|uniref:SAM-dependent methyltransferase n=1 Tax=Nonomuraea mangrovi TaxID=2316207 RepID=A0ABW4T5Z6_9ACTN
MTEQAPPGVDPTIPSVARMYDYYLDGKANFPADRAAADRIIQLAPDAREQARRNREFLGRVVRHLRGQGVTQFLDVGAGLPTQENVHQVAGAGARVVYVDNDPTVLAHARALLDREGALPGREGAPREGAAPGREEAASDVVVMEGDLRDPAAILDAAPLDFTRPVAILLVAVLHFVPDDDETLAIVSEFRSRLKPGGHLVVSHIYAGDHTEETVREGAAVYSTTATGSLTGRDPERIARYFEGMELLEPGIVPVEAWRPAVPVEVDLVKPGILGAVGIVG